MITVNDLCDNLRNYFECEKRKGVFEIKNGTIDLPFLLNGQYFRICGSVLNDGVFRYPHNSFLDETFSGEIWAMAVPPRLVALLAEINEWDEKYGEQTPYSSESFGGYSYSRVTDSMTGGAVTWQSVFRQRLNNWRKI